MGLQLPCHGHDGRPGPAGPCPGKRSPGRRKRSPPAAAKMAVDTATELLFLDTFKHQSAEVRRRGPAARLAEREGAKERPRGRVPPSGGFLSLLPAGGSGLGVREERGRGRGSGGLRVLGLREKEPGGAAAASRSFMERLGTPELYA